VSHRTIERLAEAGLLNRETSNSPAPPGKIRRTDLDAETGSKHRRSAFLRTGKLILHGGSADNQHHLFAGKTKEMIMPGIMSEGF